MSENVVVLICANTEWRAAQPFLPDGESGRTPFGPWRAGPHSGSRTAEPVIFTQTGWGKIAAAGATQHAIDRWSPRLLINVGTCGGFDGEVGQGEIILAERTAVYDIIELMGDPRAAIEHYAVTLDLSWCGEIPPMTVRRAPLVSADRDLHAGELLRLGAEFGAIAGDWESGAIAWTAARNGVPTLILRGVSDLVGSSGGEAYGALDLFANRCPAIMERLIASLPAWIERFDASTRPR